MRSMRYVRSLLTTACALVVVAGTVEAQDKEATIRANLAKLPEKDRKLAEAQKWCAVEDENRLGSMGTPYKVMVKDQPVFLCCKSCQRRATADPDKTLSKVAELKHKAGDPDAK